ncbi:MAG: hypothetical protein E2O90_09880 [Alphaproteobacteria bacterium]|nr:hypothetical protein [Pseudomonadota bacterium]TDI64396.1 MAG: hypothetical protein E2O90_09880 [Alphaproteobacteria bacterium]
MPRDEETIIRDGHFLERIPQEIRETFTDRQIAAVEQAFGRGRHGVDIRVSVPLPGGRRYLVLLLGKEQRSRERRRFERLRQPVLTAMNVIAMATMGMLIFFFAVGLAHTMFK